MRLHLARVLLGRCSDVWVEAHERFDETLLDDPDETCRSAYVVNGKMVSRGRAARDAGPDCLRNALELTGTHMGCEMGACGACLVLLDGRAVHSA